eukprot:CAMPEP_0185760722 /NCGR_PEP_ID=MMETSP1174-20130828/19638_1 /TAXON_ID=35687 /ORGANISM="Dictyocha speculum, Strain CCMP1381" /LENGTH=100 /DNA_ID=CAMNT_0028441657 /DNA_START=23 /DNA_END=322 /DNA_ORIENTATION=+
MATCPFVMAASTHTLIWVTITAPLFAFQLYQISLGVTTNERLNQGHANYGYVDEHIRKLEQLGRRDGASSWLPCAQLPRVLRFIASNWASFLVRGGGMLL